MKNVLTHLQALNYADSLVIRTPNGNAEQRTRTRQGSKLVAKIIRLKLDHLLNVLCEKMTCNKMQEPLLRQKNIYYAKSAKSA